MGQFESFIGVRFLDGIVCTAQYVCNFCCSTEIPFYTGSQHDRIPSEGD